MTNKDQIDKLRSVQNTLRSATIEEIVNDLPYSTHRHLAATELLARTTDGETIYHVIVKDYIARSAKSDDPALLEDKSEARPNGGGVTMAKLSNDAELAKLKAERNKWIKRITKETQTRYLSKLPLAIPNGRVLVHNHIRPVSRINLNGFRIWTQIVADTPKLVVCDCG